MSEEILRRLAIGPNGEVDESPLSDWRFRYYPDRRHWRRIAQYSSRLPRIVSRSTIADELGIEEAAILAWERALSSLRCDSMSRNAESLLTVVDGVPVSRDPLVAWRLRYFPEGRRWRRTRSHREEVSRCRVAREVGVREELIELWEEAVAGGEVRSPQSIEQGQTRNYKRTIDSST